MLKKRILNKLGGIFEEWLLGFNPETDFNVGIFSSEKVNLKNAILNTNRVNELLYEQKVAVRLRAGLVGKLSVKTSLLNLFSDSLSVEVSDIHLIFGPNRDELSRPKDFSEDPKGCFYDTNDQITNIVMMHELVDELLKSERQEERNKKRAGKQKRKAKRAKRRQELQKKCDIEEARRRRDPAAYEAEQRRKRAKKANKEFSAPPVMGLLTRLFRGIKFEFKNIHIRYEDDFFAFGNPFSFGFTIQKIKMDNHTEEETRQRTEENASTILKLQEVTNVSFYWNSMSEMFIPTSVYDQAMEMDLTYGIFELIEADMILEMMKDIFTRQHGMSNEYLIDPFSCRIQFAFRNTYNPQSDEYKYRIAVVNDKIRLNVKPLTLCDMMRFVQYKELQSYIGDLKRYRPMIRIQTFIDMRKKLKERNPNAELPDDIEEKREAVVKDWFRLVLWYVRLRRAARGETPGSLLMVEERIQRQKFFNGVMRVKQAKLRDYIPFVGSDEESSEVEEHDPEVHGYNDGASVVDNDEEMMTQEEMEQQGKTLVKKLKSQKNLRQFLNGVQLFVRCQGLKLNLYSPSRSIIKSRKIGPNFSLDVQGFGIFFNFISDAQQGQLVAKLNISLTHVIMLDSSKVERKGTMKFTQPQMSRAKSSNVPGIQIDRHSSDGNSREGAQSSSRMRMFSQQQNKNLQDRPVIGEESDIFGALPLQDGRSQVPSRNQQNMQSNYSANAPQQTQTEHNEDYAQMQNLMFSSIDDRGKGRQSQAIRGQSSSMQVGGAIGLPSGIQAIRNAQLGQKRPSMAAASSHQAMEHMNKMSISKSAAQGRIDPTDGSVRSKQGDPKQVAADPAQLPVMNSKRLEKFSAKYQSDDGSQVEQRCFFLFAGSDLNSGSAFSFDLTFIAPDDPNGNKNAFIEIKVDDLVVEQCSDVIISLTRLVPDFKTIMRYDDLYPKPDDLNLQKKIRFQAPLYYLRNQIIKTKFTQQQIKIYHNKIMDNKRKEMLGVLDEEEKANTKAQQEEMEALEKAQLKIQKIDQIMKNLDIKLKFELVKVEIDMTGNKSDFYGNSKLMSFGIKNQGFTIQKKGTEILINMFGITIGSYNKFEELYKFLMRTKNTMQQVTSQLQGVVSQEKYVQEMQKAIEEAKVPLDRKSIRFTAKQVRDFQDNFRAPQNFGVSQMLNANKDGMPGAHKERGTAQFGAAGAGRGSQHQPNQAMGPGVGYMQKAASMGMQGINAGQNALPSGLKTHMKQLSNSYMQQQ